VEATTERISFIFHLLAIRWLHLTLPSYHDMIHARGKEKKLQNYDVGNEKSIHSKRHVFFSPNLDSTFVFPAFTACFLAI